MDKIMERRSAEGEADVVDIERKKQTEEKTR
jgi:hypothetical protein